MCFIYVVGEDALCCALGSKLIESVIGWKLAQPAINTRGVTNLRRSMRRYMDLSKGLPVICIADTDGGCAVQLLEDWTENRSAENFLLRFAVSESESWILADSESMARYFRISEGRLPRRPDEEVDAKRTLLNLARRSGRRDIRTEVLSGTDPSRPGSGYNVHLGDYVMNHWRPREAMARSPSLARAISRVEALAARRE